MEKEKSVLLNIWFAYVMFYVCFKHLFINDNFLYVLMDTLFLLIVMETLYHKNIIKIKNDWIFHIILVLNMFFSVFYARSFGDALKFSIIFSNFLLIAIWFSFYSGWQKKFYSWMKYGCLFHLAFTIFSVAFKETSLRISARFLDSEMQRMTVRWMQEFHQYAGISGQLGTNAFFFSVLIGLFGAEWCAAQKIKTSTKILYLFSWMGLILTGKKGLLITVFVTTIVICWTAENKFSRRKILELMSLGGVGISILGIALHKRIQEIFYVSVVSRIQIMQGMVAAILEKPIFGNGVNSVGFFTYDSHLGHNIYLQMWVEQGIIGLVVLLFMLFFPLFLTLKRIRRQNPGFKVNNTNYYFSLFMQIFVIVYGFSGNPLYDYNIIITYFLALSSGMSKG